MSIAEDWARCRKWVEKAIATNDFYTMEFVEQSIESGRMHFWPGKTCVVITDFMEFPNGKALNIFLVGGKRFDALKELHQIEARISAFAKETGCRWILGHGRTGWEKLGRHLGYKQVWTVLTKDI